MHCAKQPLEESLMIWMTDKTVINADGLILGRMASIVAKRLLKGEIIDIVNAEKTVVSGKRLFHINKRKEFLNVGGRNRGPIHWRQPHRIVRRTIRGMLPYRKRKGRDAFGNLKVHIGVPDEFERSVFDTISEADYRRLRNRYVTVGEIAKTIGWKE